LRWNTCLRAGVLAFAMVLGGCASTPQTSRLLASIPAEFNQPVVLENIRFFPQDDYQCGPASLATLFHWQGIDISPDALRQQVYIPERKGSLQIEMLAATRRQGLLPYILRPQLDELLSEVKHGRPVLVFQNLGVSWYPQWHYAVVIGFDLHQEQLILHTGRSRAYAMDIHTFERTWMRTRRWAMVALRPGQMPANPEPGRYLDASVGLERTGQLDLVRTAYAAGLQQWPENQALNMGMGNLHYAQHEFRLAQKYFTQVTLRYPDFAPAHNNLALTLAHQGHFDSAYRHVERAIALGGIHSAQYQSTLDEIRAMQGKN